MSWPWQTFEEFTEVVRPIEATVPTFLVEAIHGTTAEAWHSMLSEIHDFADAVEQLRRFSGLDRRCELQDEDLRDAIDNLTLAVLHGERLLGHDRRLVESEAGRDYISTKYFMAEGDRFIKEKRFVGKLHDFHEACKALLAEVHRQTEQSHFFLTGEVELPVDLEADFITARNLFSVGFDEAGLIYCGRGLEGVVRRIAKDHSVGPSPTERAKFFDILTALEKKRFSHNQALVIEESTKHLLHYSRVTRNNSAHPSPDRQSEPYREQAILMAKKASELWKQCSAQGVQFV